MNLTDPSRNIVAFLEQGDYDNALTAYEDKLDSKSTKNLEKNMKVRIEAIKTGFADKSIDYAAAAMELNTIKAMNIHTLAKEIAELQTYISDLNQSRTAFHTAQTMYDAGDFIGAIEQYQLVIPGDTQYETAKIGYTASVSAYRKVVLDEAAGAAAGHDYGKADLAIENGLSVLTGDPQLTEQRNLYKSEEEIYLNQQTQEQKREALTKADEYDKNGDYQSAYQIMEDTLNKMPGDIEITAKIKEYKDKETASLKSAALLQAEEVAVGGDADQSMTMLYDALKRFPGDADILAKLNEYKDTYGEKAKILNQANSAGLEIYHNEWSAVIPFRINGVEYKQDNLIGIRLLDGRWRGANSGSSLDRGYYGYMMKIDNSNLEYARMTFQTALDDLSKEQADKNETFLVYVWGYSKALGKNELYNQDLKRDAEIHSHTVDILGYEEIFIFYRSFDYNEWDYYNNYNKDWLHTVRQDYLFLFEPRVYR